MKNFGGKNQGNEFRVPMKLDVENVWKKSTYFSESNVIVESTPNTKFLCI